MTTVKNEGGQATQGLFPFPDPLSNSTFAATLTSLEGTEQATAIVSSPYYTLLARELAGGNTSESHSSDWSRMRLGGVRIGMLRGIGLERVGKFG